MSRLRASCIVVFVSSLMFDTVRAGPIHVEVDAGRLPPSAEVINGSPGSPLQRIRGQLRGFAFQGPGDFEDMYQIRIRNGCAFSASTDWSVTPGGDNDFDTQLWLFDANGLGLLGNDDVAFGDVQSAISFPATDATGQTFPGAGLYYLAISGFDDDPVSTGGAIFDQLLSPEISGPDGPGAGSPISDWSSTGFGAIGSYDIRLECASFVPEPGSLGLLALILPALACRRARWHGSRPQPIA